MARARDAKMVGYHNPSEDEDSDGSGYSEPGLKGGCCRTKSGSPKRGCAYWCASCCCLCFFCIGLPALAVFVLACLFMDPLAEAEVEKVGPEVLGVDTTVDSVDVAAFSPQSSISGLVIGSPPGYPEDFVTLGHGAFGVNFLSLVEAPFELAPLEIEELSVHSLTVRWDQRADGDSNARGILSHIQQVVPMSNDTEGAGDLIHRLTSKMVLDVFELEDITAAVGLLPFTEWTGALTYHIDRVRVTGVGRKQDGVYLYDLLSVLAHAVICAAIEAAPANIRENMVRSVGHFLQRELDFEDMLLLNSTGGWVDIFTPVVKSPFLLGELATGIGIADKLATAGVHAAGLEAQAGLGVAGTSAKTGVGTATQSAETGINIAETSVETGIHTAAQTAEGYLAAAIPSTR